MTRDEAVLEYTAHVERNGGSQFTEAQWVEWRTTPRCSYRIGMTPEVGERGGDTYFERRRAEAYRRLRNGG